MALFTCREYQLKTKDLWYSLYFLWGGILILYPFYLVLTFTFSLEIIVNILFLSHCCRIELLLIGDKILFMGFKCRIYTAMKKSYFPFIFFINVCISPSSFAHIGMSAKFSRRLFLDCYSLTKKVQLLLNGIVRNILDFGTKLN